MTVQTCGDFNVGFGGFRGYVGLNLRQKNNASITCGDLNVGYGGY